MDRKEYYKRIVKKLDDSLEELQGMKKEYDQLEADIKSGKYDYFYIQKTLRPKADHLYRVMEDRQSAIEKEFAAINREYTAVLRDEDSLRADEMTEDVKLFTSGIKLTARDIQDIINRNSNNRTMTQLAIRYARENKLDVKSWYIPAEQEAKSLDAVEYTINTILKWYKSPDACKRMYDQLIGEGSQLANWCGVTGSEEE